jgi:CO/xanthine dehydrogenase FAD-binding subunit
VAEPIVPTPFLYTRPETLEAALRAMAEDGAHALAGGSDLVSLRAAGAIAPRLLVDLKRVGCLRGVTCGPDEISIGATTTMAELAALRDPRLDAVIDGAAIVGGAQTRSRATLGGNLCRSSPAGDALCGLLVLDAIVDLRSSGAARSVPVREFFTGPGRNVRAADEIVVAIRLPARRGSSAYRRFTYRRSMDLAVVGVAARLAIEAGRCVEASIAIGAAGPTPRLVPEAARALLGGCDDRAIATASDLVVETASPIDDVRGTRRHRLRVLRSLSVEVLALARSRQAAAR